MSEKRAVDTFYDLEHRPLEGGPHPNGPCVCGQTRAVMVTLDGNKVPMEAHSSGASLVSLMRSTSGYNLFKKSDGEWYEDKQIKDADFWKPIILHDGDEFYVVPPGTMP